MNILEIKSAPATLRVNYNLLPVTRVNTVEEFNTVSSYWRERERRGLITRGIARTPSGGISVVNLVLPSYDVFPDANNGCELLVLALNEDDTPAFYRVQYRAYKKELDEKGRDIILSGHQGYLNLREELRKDGQRIEDWFIDDGEEVKKLIQKPLIYLFHEELFADLTFDNAHHLDINSSYPAGMAEFIPEWRPTIERLYEERNKNKYYSLRNKSILVNAIGWFQSLKWFKARLAHVSEYAIRRNNEKVIEMANWLESTGRTILCYNIDGIWFQGESTRIKSSKLGEFNEDHTNCRIRFKSKGCYEYIEDGVYHPVVRGRTRLDETKSRESWQWGDIYQEDAEIIQYYFDYEEGIIKEHNRESLEEFLRNAKIKKKGLG